MNTHCFLTWPGLLSLFTWFSSLSMLAALPANFHLSYIGEDTETIVIQAGQLIRLLPANPQRLHATLNPQQLADLENWLKRHRIVSLPRNFSMTKAASDACDSLAVRAGERLQIITWTAASPPPELSAAIEELKKLCGFALENHPAAKAKPGSLAALEQTLQEILKPSKKLPFKSVVHATTRHTLLDFDPTDNRHRELKQRISLAASLAGKKAHSKGLFTARANEAGNHIEAYVKAALRESGLAAQTPITSAGAAQISGYPDLEIPGTPPVYLELKTYNAATANTTQRSFYFSPSENPKVTQDALHLLLAYQLEKSTRAGEAAFVPVHWKLITLQDLSVDLKFEFNQSNRGLYGVDAAKAVLAEGGIEGAAEGKERK